MLVSAVWSALMAGEVSISNSYAIGSVSGGYSAIGGLVGSNAWGASIANSYATGSVSGGYNDFGGLVGIILMEEASPTAMPPVM